MRASWCTLQLERRMSGESDFLDRLAQSIADGASIDWDEIDRLPADDGLRKLLKVLRVVGDVRINTNKQGLFEFIDWAHKHTGVERSNVYYNLFPAHEGMFPGYATCYAVVGEEIHEIENRLTDPKKRIKFST